jgi:teichuronic acid biosynthesis glycosyltransferase TuaG
VISVITPAFNAAATLQETIDSVLAQTYAEWEMLIVDDGSADGTLEIAQAAARNDHRIQVLRQHNQGVSSARNAALRDAAGRYVAFLDADDVWMPRKLESHLAFMQGCASAFSFTGYRKFSAAGIGTAVEVPRYVTYRALLKSRPIMCSSVMIDRRFAKIHMPDLGRGSGHEDLVAWLKLLRMYWADGLNEDLLRLRIHPGSRSYNKVEAARNVWRVYREHERLSISAAAWYFAHYAINSIRARI